MSGQLYGRLGVVGCGNREATNVRVPYAPPEDELDVAISQVDAELAEALASLDGWASDVQPIVVDRKASIGKVAGGRPKNQVGRPGQLQPLVPVFSSCLVGVSSLVFKADWRRLTNRRTSRTCSFTFSKGGLQRRFLDEQPKATGLRQRQYCHHAFCRISPKSGGIDQP
jgi:hypothetical protein